MGFISDCCGAIASDPVMLDMLICPDCKEYCEFLDEEEINDETDQQKLKEYHDEN